MRLGRAVPASTPEALFAHRAFCARLIFIRAEAERVRLPLKLGLEPLIPVRALIAASRRSRSARSCWTICSIGMGGIVANGEPLAQRPVVDRPAGRPRMP